MDTLPELRILSLSEGNEKRIIFHFERASGLENRLRQLPGCSWSEIWQGWHIPNNPASLRLVFRTFRGLAYVDATGVFNRPNRTDSNSSLPSKTEKTEWRVKKMLALPGQTNKRIEEFPDWMKVHRYSPNTIRLYSDGIRKFFRYHRGKRVEELSNRDLEDFNRGYVLRKGYSGSYQNQVINAVKLFYRKMERRMMVIEEIERPRREHMLPNVLGKEEVKSILSAPVNLKHRAMLSLIYACGLKRSELLNLKLTDVESDRGLLGIRQSKGNKDRVIPISEKMVMMLREDFRSYRPKVWSFEGQVRGEPYSAEGFQEALKKSVAKAGIRKPVTLHWLRHSYATHLLESGTDLRYIQELLGHKSSRTTEIYTHASCKNIQQIKSPFDNLCWVKSLFVQREKTIQYILYVPVQDGFPGHIRSLANINKPKYEYYEN